MSLCRSVAFLKVNTNTGKSPDSVKEFQFNDQFNYVNGPGFSKRDNHSVAPLRPSSPNTKSRV